MPCQVDHCHSARSAAQRKEPRTRFLQFGETAHSTRFSFCEENVLKRLLLNLTFFSLRLRLKEIAQQKQVSGSEKAKEFCHKLMLLLRRGTSLIHPPSQDNFPFLIFWCLYLPHFERDELRQIEYSHTYMAITIELYSQRKWRNRKWNGAKRRVQARACSNQQMKGETEWRTSLLSFGKWLSAPPAEIHKDSTRTKQETS